jgi:HK97 family phage prohead protease
MDRRDRELRAGHVRTPRAEAEAAFARARALLEAFKRGEATREEVEEAERVWRLLETSADVEQREVRSSGPVIAGIVPYNEVASIGAFDEVLKPGAFRSVLSQDVILTVAHELGGAELLARTSNGTLRLEDRADGLHFTAQLPASAESEHVAGLVADGSYGVSFGFSNPRVRWDESRGRPLREVVDVGTMLDLSLVSFPAYPSARAWLVAGGDRSAGATVLPLRRPARREIGTRIRHAPDGRIIRVPIYEGEEPTLGSERHRLQLARMRLELARRRIPAYAVVGR